jgi:hypothetical protein
MLNHTTVKAGSLLLLAIALCGCTHTWNYPPLKPNDQYRDIAYKYYVIDANADVPDASFETFEEASVYQKEYAEYHDYVIVKIDKSYKVYNMELTDRVKNEN